MKIPPQVIVGCGCLMDVIISLFRMECSLVRVRREGSRNQTTEIGANIVAVRSDIGRVMKHKARRG